jgi:hypothetical protein
MSPDQRADAGAVDHRYGAQIDDEVALATAEELLDVALEGLGSTAGDQRHLGRQNESIDGVSSGVWHGSVLKQVSANYTPARV